MSECKYCKKEFIARQFPKTFCSYSCYEHWLKEPNCVCAYCKIPIYRKPFPN